MVGRPPTSQPGITSASRGKRHLHQTHYNSEAPARPRTPAIPATFARSPTPSRTPSKSTGKSDNAPTNDITNGRLREHHEHRLQQNHFRDNSHNCADSHRQRGYRLQAFTAPRSAARSSSRARTSIATTAHALRAPSNTPARSKTNDGFETSESSNNNEKHTGGCCSIEGKHKPKS
ncbi:hypothetical protein ON010_g2044 [Phytophthora cinnamomi]|nr:hypothetical protein ON010_g2044 [Phytophthora cinnamomi]